MSGRSRGETLGLALALALVLIGTVAVAVALVSEIDFGGDGDAGGEAPEPRRLVQAGMSFALPQGWTDRTAQLRKQVADERRDEQQPDELVAGAVADSDDGAATLLVTRRGPPLSRTAEDNLRDAAQTNAGAMCTKQTFAGSGVALQSVTPIGPTTVGGEPAVACRFTQADGGEGQAVFTVHARRQYTLMISGGDAGEHANALALVRSTLHWSDRAGPGVTPTIPKRLSRRDFTFELPEGWRDRTGSLELSSRSTRRVVGLSGPKVGSHDEPVLVIDRSVKPASRALRRSLSNPRRFCRKDLFENPATIRSVRSAGATSVDGEPAAACRFRFAGEDSGLEGRLIDTIRGSKQYVIRIVWVTKGGAREPLEALERVRSSLRWR